MGLYGLILFNGANMIGDGSELLMNIKKWEPIVGPLGETLPAHEEAL